MGLKKADGSYWTLTFSDSGGGGGLLTSLTLAVTSVSLRA